MRNKGLSLLLCLAMVLGVFLAPAALAEPVEIAFSTGADATGGFAKVVEDFNKLHEGEIHVKLVEMPNNTTQQHDMYVTSLSSNGTEYDVISGDCIWPAEFSNAGYVLPLDRYLERDDVSLDDYMQGTITAATFKGKLWALPRYVDAGMMFYRTDLVDAPPATYEDLLKIGGELQAAGKVESGYVSQGAQYEGLVCNAVEYINAYGGAVVDGDGNVIINSPNTIAGLQAMQNLYRSTVMPPNTNTIQENETVAAFTEGKAAFARNWSYMWALCQAEGSQVAGKVAIAPLPTGSVQSSACLGGWMGMINANSKNPDASWEFLKYLCGFEGQKTMAIVAGHAPTMLSVYKDADVLAANPHYGVEGFVESMSVAAPRPVSPVYATLSEIMQVEISKCLSGQLTVEEAVANMDKQMKAAVEAAA